MQNVPKIDIRPKSLKVGAWGITFSAGSENDLNFLITVNFNAESGAPLLFHNRVKIGSYEKIEIIFRFSTKSYPYAPSFTDFGQISILAHFAQRKF